MTLTERRPDPSVVAPAILAVVQAVVVLGPGLGRGVVVTHDMPWSPVPSWTPFVLGLDTPAPRVVPSDAFAVLLGKVVGASLAQHLVLGGILVALALGAVALLREIAPEPHLAACAVAAVAAVWNPYVSERLAVGQWTVLLGLAVLPWALRAAVRVVTGHTSGYAVLLAVLCAAVGGVNSVLVVASGVLLALLTGAVVERSPRVGRVALVAAAVTLGASAAWALPGLLARPTLSEAASRAFRPLADTPIGVVGSLAGGGGFWNVATHPEPRAHLLIAVTAALLGVAGVGFAVFRAGPVVSWLLGVPVVVLSALVVVSATDSLAALWGWVVTGLPGGGALRDSQKLMAAWVVTSAVGLGVLADVLRRWVPKGLGAPAVGLLVGLPVVLSPQLAWGLGGWIEPVTVPSGYRSAMAAVAELPDGEVGLLPWNQYRRYEWNADRVSLTLAPRMLDRIVVYDDSLPLRAGTVPGESARAAAVSGRIADGAGHGEALAASGVRYLVAELEAGLPVDTGALRDLGTVAVDREHLLVVDLGGPPTTPEWPGALLLGWGVTLLTGVGVVGWRVATVSRRKLLTGLLTSQP